MIIPTSPILANGKTFTRNSVAARVNGILRTTAVDSISWSDEKPHELVPAMNSGGPPLGKAEGNYACTAMIGIFASHVDQFEAAILAGDPLALLNLSAANFQMVITLTERALTKSIIWRDCNIVGRGDRTIGSDGSAIVFPYTIQPTYILEDGKGLVNLQPAL